MRFGTHCNVAVFIVLGASFGNQAKEPNNLGRREVSGQEALKVAAQNSNPESPEGLKNFLQDLFAAVKAGNAAKSAALEAEFSIPNHKEWVPRIWLY